LTLRNLDEKTDGLRLRCTYTRVAVAMANAVRRRTPATARNAATKGSGTPQDEEDQGAEAANSCPTLQTSRRRSTARYTLRGRRESRIFPSTDDCVIQGGGLRLAPPDGSIERRVVLTNTRSIPKTRATTAGRQRPRSRLPQAAALPRGRVTTRPERCTRHPDADVAVHVGPGLVDILELRGGQALRRRRETELCNLPAKVAQAQSCAGVIAGPIDQVDIVHCSRMRTWATRRRFAEIAPAVQRALADAVVARTTCHRVTVSTWLADAAL